MEGNQINIQAHGFPTQGDVMFLGTVTIGLLLIEVVILGKILSELQRNNGKQD